MEPIERNSTSLKKAVSVSKAVLSERYPSALFAYACGSIFRGEGKFMSDIDLVVVYDQVVASKRESFSKDDVPVEAFVHDLETLSWFVDSDIKRGRPSLLNMISQSTVIGLRTSVAEVLKSTIQEKLAAGPPRLSDEEIRSLRYEITDAIDDLKGDRPMDEVQAIGCMLYSRMVELTLRGRGRWYGTGKWAPKLLRELDPNLAQRFQSSYHKLFCNGEYMDLIDLAEEELSHHGGRLFEGDVRISPPDWRKNALVERDPSGCSLRRAHLPAQLTKRHTDLRLRLRKRNLPAHEARRVHANREMLADLRNRYGGITTLTKKAVQQQKTIFLSATSARRVTDSYLQSLAVKPPFSNRPYVAIQEGEHIRDAS